MKKLADEALLLYRHLFLLKNCVFTAIKDIIIDCQVFTKYLESFGAINIPRRHYLSILEKGLEGNTLCGNWDLLLI